MKKVLLGLSAIVLFSCSSNNEQVSVVKSALLKRNVTKDELSKMNFDVVKIAGKDAYKSMFDKFSKEHENLTEVQDFDGATRIMQKIDSLSLSYDKIKTKEYYRVHSYIVDKDTTFNETYFLTDKNTIYGFK
jgi:hypothetical protein